MVLDISKQNTAILAMDFENDIVHLEGAFKDFGFAQMVADNRVLEKTSQLLAVARGAGVSVIYVSVKFRPGYPERAANAAERAAEDAKAAADKADRIFQRQMRKQ
mgnify:CR=1 FL=1